MELGFHTIHFSPVFGGTARLADVVDAAIDAGFDAMGFDLASVDAHLSSGGTIAGIAAQLEQAGLDCSDVLVLAAASDRDVVGAARRLAEMAAGLRAPRCITAVAGAVPWTDLVATLRECSVILTDHGVELAIEFLPYTPLASLREAKHLCDEVGWDRARLVIDSLHFFRARTPWSELAGLDARQIALVQYSDAPARAAADLVDESRNHRLVPGEGSLPLHQFVDTIRGLGFDGLVSAEILSESFRRAEPAAGAHMTYNALARDWISDPLSATR